MVPLLALLLEISAQHQAALTAYKQHKFAEAVVEFTEALKSEQPETPEYEESVLLLGQSLYLQSKYADAIQWLEKAVGGKSPTAEAAYMLGNACILSQQGGKAVKAFAQLFHVPPDSAAAHLTTARMMMHQDLADEAANQAKAALQIDARIPEAHFLLGEVAIFHADIDGAIAELKKEIELNPTFAMAHYRLGDAYSRTEDWDHAMEPLERSIWLNSNYSGPYILLGKGYLKKKELANAEGVLRHALRLDPQNLSAHYLLGQTLTQEGKPEEGEKEFARWKELQGKR
ncbi:MAG TPA: tetratricopeptide repeat protein [Bryobacteraceae bacterium]|nr:tetratricopeptide repeat protein [Bryobacteraceae bacterium]